VGAINAEQVFLITLFYLICLNNKYNHGYDLRIAKLYILRGVWVGGCGCNNAEQEVS